MKKIVICFVFLVVCVGVWMFIRQTASARWEATLLGPFYGNAYAGAITGAPVSSLSMENGARLEIYESDPYGAPLLNLRSTSGSNLWSRLLVPADTASDGSKRRGEIKYIELSSVRITRHGYKIYFLCDWTWGGKEAGVIHLSRDKSFQSFFLSW